MKLNARQKKWLLLGIVLGIVFLSGCARYVDSEGHTLPDKIIYLSTTWGSMWENEGLITFLFVYPLAQCINWLDQYMNVGAAIAITALILNLILLKPSIKSTMSTQKMQMLQPEMQKIQAKYEGRTDQNSQMRQAAEMQALYQKYDINPLGSMIMPFVQLPIIIAMYYAVQRADAVVNGTMFGVPLSTTPGEALKMGGNGIWLFLIFVLMGCTQYVATNISRWLAKRANEKSRKVKKYDEKKDSSQTQMQMMSVMMLLMIVLLAYRWPTAMSWYWLISSLINIAKTVYIQRRYIDHAEA